MAAFGPPPGHPAAPSKNGQILSNLWGPPQLQDWVALPRERDWRVPINAHSFLELGVEVMLWSASLWLTVNFKARYGLKYHVLNLPSTVGLHFIPRHAFCHSSLGWKRNHRHHSIGQPCRRWIFDC
jgi:hypothetical protein